MPRRSERQSAIDRFYTRWAGLYDLVARRAPGIDRVRETAIESLDLSAGETAVEMGCGTGANLPHLSERVGAGGRVVGIDLAAGALRRAHRDATRDGPRTVHVVRGDATSPPIERADAVLATFVVGMLDDPANAVERWCDLLDPGGRIALLNATRSDRSLRSPLNLAFRGFVRAGAPGRRLSRASPARDLEARVEAAHDALETRCVDVRRESLFGGFLVLASGYAHEN